MTTLDVDIVGLKALTDQLIALGADADDVIEGAIFDLANETRNLAIAGISGGAKTGRTYRRGNVTHIASAPGQYPASDTGRLAGSIKAIINGTTAIVGTNVAYGPMLEFGTSRMAARPWLLPSFKAASIGLEKGLKAAIEARVK